MRNDVMSSRPGPTSVSSRLQLMSSGYSNSGWARPAVLRRSWPGDVEPTRTAENSRFPLSTPIAPSGRARRAEERLSGSALRRRGLRLAVECPHRCQRSPPKVPWRWSLSSDDYRPVRGQLCRQYSELKIRCIGCPLLGVSERRLIISGVERDVQGEAFNGHVRHVIAFQGGVEREAYG